MSEIDSILAANERAIDKWVNRPKLSPRMNIVDKVKLLHDTKRYFIVDELKKASKVKGGMLRVLDFGSGQGGVTIDVKTALGERVSIVGYDVSPKAVNISRKAAGGVGADVDFCLDEKCDPCAALGEQFDAIISCDVFGHLPSVPKAFKDLYMLLKPGGVLIAFSETVTGEALRVPTYLYRQGFKMDDSEEEHISLHSVFELHRFLDIAGFSDIRIYPYDPIRFAFYPKRYLKKLLLLKSPLALVAAMFALFQNRITEILYNQFNLYLSKKIALKDTAGCLIFASKKDE